MVEAMIVLNNKSGLHARPAAKLVSSAKKFKSNITLAKNGKEADAKSILKILSLGAEKGDQLLIKVIGEDEKEAYQSLISLINNKFNEE